MRQLIKILAVFEAFALAFTFINIWFLAFLNGGKLTIHLNLYSEVWAEYVLWLLLTPLLVLGSHYIIQDM